MARKMALPEETVNAMIETFTNVCFFLEDFRIGEYMSEYAKGVYLKWCVEDADYATFRQHGYRIRDIFVK